MVQKNLGLGSKRKAPRLSANFAVEAVLFAQLSLATPLGGAFCNPTLNYAGLPTIADPQILSYQDDTLNSRRPEFPLDALLGWFIGSHKAFFHPCLSGGLTT
jgi:hypothetical protein